MIQIENSMITLKQFKFFLEWAIQIQLMVIYMIGRNNVQVFFIYIY